ncbi:unnamed protein product [Phaedon cochleariae]|uniref:TAFH domain-containing protein n=1 Tax=Phaedon cochleariae TaxID=80249 RepID=A0A9P0GPR0_PHACE|nr:unnamed protein product [Phaedon cochleariae]
MPKVKQTRKRKHESKTTEKLLEEKEYEIDVPKSKFRPFDEKAQAEEEHLSHILFGGTSFLKCLEEAEQEAGQSQANVDSGVGEDDSSENDENARKPAWTDEDDDGIEVGQALDAQRRKLPNGGINSQNSKYSKLLKHKFQSVVGNPKWASLNKRKHSESDSEEEILQHCGFIKKTAKALIPPSVLEFKKVKDLNCETYSEGPYINSIEFHPTSTVALVTGNAGIASLFSVDGKRNNKLHSVAFDRYPIICAKFCQNGNEAILGSRQSHIFSYDLLAAKHTRINLPPGLTQFKNFVISPDYQFIAAAGKWGEVHLLSSGSKERIALLKQDSEVTALEFSPSGKLLFGHSVSGEVTIWDMKMKRVKHKFIDEGCLQGTTLSISSSYQFLAAGSAQGVVNLYNMEDVLQSNIPKPRKTILNLTTSVGDLKFNSSSEILGFSSPEIPNSVKLYHSLVGSRKMASANFLEEALSTDVDESAFSAIVGSLENQLVTSAPQASGQTGSAIVINQNHINSAISNGGTVAPQKHGTIANGDSISAVNTNDGSKQVTNNAMIISGATGAVTTGYINQSAPIQQNKPNEGVKIVYSQGQGNQVMTSAGTIIQNRVTIPTQSLPNGAIGLPPQSVLQTNPNNVQTIQNKQPTLVLKTSGAPGSQNLMTVPMNVNSSVPQANNVGSPSTQSPNILSNLQVVNVRPGVPTQQTKGQPARVVLSAPQIVGGARQGAPQLTLQSFHGLQPGQQGALLLKTENGQYQLLRVGPAPASNISTSQPGGQPVTFRMQTVQAQTATSSSNNVVQHAGATTTVTSTPQPIQQTQVGQVQVQVQRPANDNTKEKCRKFLANLLELSSRETKSVERNVRTLIQELIDNKVEPEDFCDKLEKLLNASPQPCLIGFLKKSLPLLRQSLANGELTIDGIRPPPANVVFSLAGATPTVQTVHSVRPAGLPPNQVRIVGPGAAVVRPAQVVQQRQPAPVARQPPPHARMVTAVRQPAGNVMVGGSQPPALHPVFPNGQQMRPAAGMNVRHPMQVRTMAPGQIRQQMQVRAAVPVQKQPAAGAGAAGGAARFTGAKTPAPAASKQSAAKDKEKKAFSAAYAGDDDINDVAAMGGVNLAEETQKILGSTEFVGTQIRSCKEDVLCAMAPLQHRIRQIVQRHGLDEPGPDVAACISHAAQERLKNVLEKLSIIAEHRLENVKAHQRYEVTNDVKGQLKFLEDLDKAERKRHEESEREMLMRAAKSRSRAEDPEQAKLKAKAKEMQRVEMEELRQREANATALQAIGPRKRARVEGEPAGTSQASAGGSNNGTRNQLPLRQRMKKVTLRDLQFVFETEKDLCKSKLLYKSYLK